MAEVSADNISLINNNSGPYLLLGQKTVLDPPPGGNGNGRFDPGERGGLVLALRNIGNENGENINTRLRSDDPRFVITDSVANYGTIPACSTRTNESHPFQIQIHAGMPKETSVRLSLFITGNGYNDTLTFSIIVGELVVTDPIPDNAQPPIYWAYDDGDTLYPEHPVFSWVEIRDIGTRLNLSDDQTVQVDLPFTWQFYGTQFNQVSICSNGWVAPGYTTATVYINTALPTTSLPGVVCLNWDDLYPPAGNGVWYYHDAPNHRFVIEWDSVYYLSSQQWDKFEILIYDNTIPTPTGDNLIVVQYLTGNNYVFNTVGIQDPTCTYAIQCLFDGTYNRGTAPLVSGRAIKYTTVAPTAVKEEQAGYQPRTGLRVLPNPARGMVRFAAPVSGAALLFIYDQSGRLVRTVTGNGNWCWDGKDDYGRAVPAGVYFCRLNCENNRIETKLVLSR